MRFLVTWKVLGMFLFNFLISVGIFKFYFDKKLVTQKEDSDKKITELNGIIARSNHAHAIIIKKQIELYESIWFELSSFSLLCEEI